MRSAERSLRAQVFAQRRPGLHRFLDYEDEAFATLMLLAVCCAAVPARWAALTRLARRSSRASRRATRRLLRASTVRYSSAALTQRSVTAATSRTGLRRISATGDALSQRQRLLSLLTLVVLPYVYAKAERTYVARTGGDAARLSLLGPEEQVRPHCRWLDVVGVQMTLPPCAGGGRGVRRDRTATGVVAA